MLATVIAFFVQRPALIVLALLMVAFGVEHVELGSARKAAVSAQDGWKGCRTTLTTQNAALAAQSARSVSALASASKAQASVAPRATHFAGQSAALSAYKPKGSDRCEQLEDAVTEARESFQ